VVLRRPTSPKRAESALSLVVPCTFTSDAALVTGVIEGDPGAIETLYDRHASYVTRVLARILGAEPEIAELEHEVFLRALNSIERLKDPSSIRAWLAGIAVFTAKTCIQRRRRGAWLRFFSFDEVPEVEATTASDEVGEAVRATYAILDSLPADERIAFALRVIDGMDLTEIAAACDASISTVKRRIARAERRFLAMAREQPALVDWVEGGARWGANVDR